MAILEVNTQKIDFHSSDYLNIRSLIPKVQKRFPIDHFKLRELRVNGDIISMDSTDFALTRPIRSEDHIQVIFSPNESFSLNLINELPGIIDKINDQIIKCSKNFETNQGVETSHELTCIIENIDIFLHTINNLYQKFVCATDMVDTLPIKELQIHLLSVMKGIHTSHQKHDHIMLTDLLEYELKDNLTQWKILIVPTLKKLALSFS